MVVIYTVLLDQIIIFTQLLMELSQPVNVTVIQRSMGNCNLLEMQSTLIFLDCLCVSDWYNISDGTGVSAVSSRLALHDAHARHT